MNILIICSEHFLTENIPLGGIFQWHQAQHLSNAGHKVCLISVGFVTTRFLFKRNEFYVDEFCDGIGIYRNYKKSYSLERFKSTETNSRRHIALFKKSYDKYVRDNGQPDIIHSHNFLYAGVLAEWVKKNFGVPFIITEHSSDFFRGSLPKGSLKILNRVSSEAAVLLTVSRENQAVLTSKLDYNFDILYNVLSPIFLGQGPKIKKSNFFVFLSVGSLDTNKNHEMMLRSFAKAFFGLNVLIKIAGEGPLKNKLHRLAHELGIHNQVVFLGGVSQIELHKEYYLADCFVHSSIFETFGVVLIEALACGLPILSTKCGGPEDIVNQSNGLLLTNNSIEEFSDAMSYMYKNTHLFNPNNLRNEAILRFGPDALVTRLEKIYKNAIND